MNKIHIFTLLLTSNAAAFDCQFRNGTGECVGWKATEVAFVLNPGALGALDGQQVVGAVKNSFETWEAVEGTAPPTFVYGGTTTVNAVEDDGTNILVFVPCNSWRYDASWASKTTLYPNWSHDGFSGVDVEVNGCLPFALNPTGTAEADPAAFDLETVLLQAAGMAYGLAPEVFITSAVMNPEIELGEVTRNLTEDDRDGIRALYGAGGCSTTGQAPLSLAGLILVALGIRRRK